MENGPALSGGLSHLQVTFVPTVSRLAGAGCGPPASSASSHLPSDSSPRAWPLRPMGPGGRRSAGERQRKQGLAIIQLWTHEGQLNGELRFCVTLLVSFTHHISSGFLGALRKGVSGPGLNRLSLRSGNVLTAWLN